MVFGKTGDGPSWSHSGAALATVIGELPSHSASPEGRARSHWPQPAAGKAGAGANGPVSQETGHGTEEMIHEVLERSPPDVHVH